MLRSPCSLVRALQLDVKWPHRNATQDVLACFQVQVPERAPHPHFRNTSRKKRARGSESGGQHIQPGEGAGGGEWDVDAPTPRR